MKNRLPFIVVFLLVTASLCRAQNPVLYGMTDGGGTYGEGVIFNFDVSTGVETTLHNFGAALDGLYPHGSLNRATNGVLYGTTQLGSTSSGTMFSYTISTATEKVIYPFATGNPWGSFIQANNGILYGMTTMGGANTLGAIYSYDITTGTATDIYDFSNNNTDAEEPYGALVQASNGLLYGTGSFGGNSVINGAIFSYDITTGAETVLHSFDSADNGAYVPALSVVFDSAGNLYGTTHFGGFNYGGAVYVAPSQVRAALTSTHG